MNIFFWTPPWPSQDNALFFKNSTKGYLIKQANMLADAGHNITFALPKVMSDISSLLHSNVKVVEFQIDGGQSVHSDLYEFDCGNKTAENQSLVASIETSMKSIFGEGFFRELDAVFLFENAAPFIKNLVRDDCPVMHQMPGVFARSPFPHTVTVDPVGLYKSGLLYKGATDILNVSRGEYMTSRLQIMLSHFRRRTEVALTTSAPAVVSDTVAGIQHGAGALSLVPLGISKHYSFKSDVGVNLSQYDVMMKALAGGSDGDTHLVTQYVHKLAQEKVLTNEAATGLRSKYPNLAFNEALDKVGGVSQFLLPHVDQVVTSTSSVGLQAVVLGKSLRVDYDTFLKPFATPVGASVEERERLSFALGAFLLDQYQPLASMMLTNALFVEALIKAHSDWLRGDRNVSSLPSFYYMLGGRYFDCIIEDIDLSCGSIDGPRDLLKTFTEQAKEADVVSFDMFDTLVARPTEKPGDMYKIIEPIVFKETEGRVSNFARVRTQAELAARKWSDEVGQDEITYDDIMRQFRSLIEITDADVTTVAQLEHHYEAALIKERPIGRQMYDIAKALGKRIIIVSDMYLSSDQLERMLFNAGYDDYDAIYVSSDLNLLIRKHDGKLFDHVLQAESLERSPEKMLHVGDNKRGDVDEPTKKKIKCIHWPQAIENMRKNPLWKSVYNPRQGAGQRARSLLAGATAQRLFDGKNSGRSLKCMFDMNPVNLGYSALGPITLGFSQWLHNKLEERGVKTVFFFAREGYLLKDALDTFAPDASYEKKYLYISRRAVRVAAIEKAEDISALASEPYEPNVALNKLFSGRFGVDLCADDLQVVKDLMHVSTLDARLNNDAVTKASFSQLALRFSDKIMQNARAEREAFVSYLKEVGLYDHTGKVGVVDVGWKANIQASLVRLLPKNVQENTEGFYYATSSDAANWQLMGHKHEAYLGTNISEASHPSAIFKNRHLFEFLVCHTDATLIRISDQLTPVFRSEEGRAQRAAFVGAIHMGAIDFIQDCVAGELGDFLRGPNACVTIDPSLAESAFAGFVTHAAKHDFEMFSQQKFEDVVGGIDAKALVKAPAKSTSNSKEKVKPDGLDDFKMEINLFGVKCHSGFGDPDRPVLERLWVRRFLPENKQGKYLKNIDRFFQDAPPLAQKWYAWSK